MWESDARRSGEFRYFMVFEENPIDGALRVDGLTKRVKNM